MWQLFINNTVGGGPTASHFSCFAKKSNPKKATPDSPSLRDSLRCSSGQAAAQLALAGHTPRAPLRSSNSARRLPLTSLRYSVANKGKEIQNQKRLCSVRDAHALFELKQSVGAVSPHCPSGFEFLVLTLHPFCIAEGGRSNWEEGDNLPHSGMLRWRLTFRLCRNQHCLSSAAAHVVCGLLGRVAQPPNLIARPKEPEGRYGRVAFSLVTFIWRSKRK
jgi:hypothetical protein